MLLQNAGVFGQSESNFLRAGCCGGAKTQLYRLRTGGRKTEQNQNDDQYVDMLFHG
jgi:hypothetical protein